jgi:hypothetical protein
VVVGVVRHGSYDPCGGYYYVQCRNFESRPAGQGVVKQQHKHRTRGGLMSDDWLCGDWGVMTVEVGASASYDAIHYVP